MSNSDIQHREANDFALDLLVPAEDFKRKVSNGMTKVSDLADHYKVGALAIRHRARTLGMKGHGLIGGYKSIKKQVKFIKTG
jgi:Zn-dependent peptidase ImmA (M78 family)